MVIQIVIAIVISLIFGYRVYKMVGYYKQSVNDPEASQRAVARSNYIIHLIACLILLAFLVFVVYEIVQV